MNGLAKTAWTKKLNAKAGKEYFEHAKNNATNDYVTPEELDRIMKYVKDNENLNIGFNRSHRLDDAFFAKPTPWAINLLKKKKKLSEGAQIILDNYKGEKDGFIHAPHTRSLLLHELGHAIDRKRNPLTSRIRGIGGGGSPTSSAIMAGLTTPTIVKQQDRDNESNPTMSEQATNYMKSGLQAAAIGTAFGLPISATEQLLENANENAANRYADQILRGTNSAKRTRELYPEFLKDHRLAKKTYTTSQLRNLKNVPIYAGTGALAGLGLAGISQGIEEVKNRTQGEREAK